MYVREKEDIRTCQVCEETGFGAYVVAAGPGVLTFCPTCAAELVRRLDKSLRRSGIQAIKPTKYVR